MRPHADAPVATVVMLVVADFYKAFYSTTLGNPLPDRARRVPYGARRDLGPRSGVP